MYRKSIDGYQQVWPPDRAVRIARLTALQHRPHRRALPTIRSIRPSSVTRPRSPRGRRVILHTQPQTTRPSTAPHGQHGHSVPAAAASPPRHADGHFADVVEREAVAARGTALLLGY